LSSPDETSIFKRKFNQLTPEAQAQMIAVERALLYAQEARIPAEEEGDGRALKNKKRAKQGKME